MTEGRATFPVSRESDQDAEATVTGATGPRETASKLSDSLLNNPLWVNDSFRTAARKQPLRFASTVHA